MILEPDIDLKQQNPRDVAPLKDGLCELTLFDLLGYGS